MVVNLRIHKYKLLKYPIQPANISDELDFTNFFYNNNLYTNNRLILFKILNNTIKKHIIALQFKKYLYKDYL